VDELESIPETQADLSVETAAETESIEATPRDEVAESP
jgi:hypothetical protein